MFKKRIILAALIVLSGVFASFYGGAARTLFYISLLILPVSLLYTFFVYLRFRVYQSVENKIIVKGERTPYRFILSDEDVISFTNVSVQFLDDFSVPQNMELCRSCHLLPHEKIDNHTEILCKYRGEYKIGVKNITVTDFLGLMSIRYPAPSTISMSVLPKIIKVEKLSLAPLDTDAKLLRYSRNSTEPPDCEMRKYVPGDSIKLINWRVSARKRELFVRQSSDVQNNEIVFIMDMSWSNIDDYSRVISEDMIIESALTTTDYLVRKRVPITLVYEQSGIKCDRIDSHERLKEFYSKCATFSFFGKSSPADICVSVPRLAMSGGGFVIFAVRELTDKLCEVCGNIIRLGGDAAVLLIGDNGIEYEKALDRRVIFKHLSLTDKIADILGGADEY